MGPAEAVHLLRRRWLTVVSAVLLCLLVAAALTARAQERYEATAQLFVSVVLPDDPASLGAVNTFTTARVQSYVSLASAPDVTDYVARELALPESGAALGRRVTANAPADKLIVNIGVSDTSAERVAVTANALARRFVTVVEGLERTAGGGASPVRVTLTRPAQQPAAPVSPRPRLNLALALLAGALLGFGAARARDALDDGVQDADQLETLTGLPVLGVLPHDRALAHAAAPPASGLSGRSLAVAVAGLELLGLGAAPLKLAVVGVHLHEGTTTVAVHLARRTAQTGATTCLVDLDLRRPGLADRLGLAPTGGLSRALLGLDGVSHLVQDVGDGLSAVGAGLVPPHPAQVLEQPHAAKVLEELARSSGWTVLDGGAVLPPGDGVRVAVLGDACLLVVRAGRTRPADVEQAVQVLADRGVRPVGVVLTAARRRAVGAFLHGRDLEPSTG